MTERRASTWRAIGLWFGIWTALGLLRAAQDVAQRSYSHQPIVLAHIVAERLLEWYTAGAVTPLYIALVRFVQRRNFSTIATFGIYAVAVVVGFVIESLVYIPIENAFFHGNASLAAGFAYDFFSYAFGNAAVFVAIIAYEHGRIAREQELRGVRLEAELAQARLDALRSQLDPHFVNNTLNSVSALLRDDPRGADEMLARLGELLRATLSASPSQEQTLGRELELIDAYLGIMRVRFGDRISISIDVASSLARERVPSFVIQPLVENAIEHGVEPIARHVTIAIGARIDDERMLAITIADDGAGLAPDAHLREGIGIGTTRRRLERLYGGAASLVLEARTGGGTNVVVRVPRRMLHD